jgi:hypothetical protein
MQTANLPKSGNTPRTPADIEAELPSKGKRSGKGRKPQAGAPDRGKPVQDGCRGVSRGHQRECGGPGGGENGVGAAVERLVSKARVEPVLRGEGLADAQGPHRDREIAQLHHEVHVVARRCGTEQGAVERQCAEQDKSRRVEQPDFAFLDERLDADRERRSDRKPQRQAHRHRSDHEIGQRGHEGEQQASFERIERW